MIPVLLCAGVVVMLASVFFEQPAGLRFQRRSLVKDAEMDEPTASDSEALKVRHV